MSIKVNGIVLPPGMGSSLGSATPEDAAKFFLKAATQGLAKVMSDAVVAAVGEAVGVGGTPPDWTKLVTGAILQLDWEKPTGTIPERVTSFSSSDGGPALGGIGFQIGISGTF